MLTDETPRFLADEQISVTNADLCIKEAIASFENVLC